MDFRLTIDEMKNPYVALRQAFEFGRIEDWQELLSETKEQLLKKSFPHAEGSIQYDNAEYFFEMAEKLVQASYLLYRNHLEKYPLG